MSSSVRPGAGRGGALGPWVRIRPGCGLSQHVLELAGGRGGRRRGFRTMLRQPWSHGLQFARTAEVGTVSLLVVGPVWSQRVKTLNAVFRLCNNDRTRRGSGLLLRERINLPEDRK